MTQTIVRAAIRIGWRIAVVAVGFGAGPLAAQTATGKIEGRVRDQAGAPIQSAQVIIEGTAFSALTNAQGYYFINNVPAGTVTLTSRFVGYKGTRVAGLKVLAGQTMTQDIQLEASPVQLTDLTVVAAQNELVPRDEVTTKQRVSGEFVEKLPVDNLSQVLALQPGVVASATGNTLSIRGGRSDEVATYIDGVPTRPGTRKFGFNTAGLGEVSLATNAIEDASVTTGASSAEFGDAQSGIISIATKTGGSSYEGRLAFESDEPFGKTTSRGFNRIEGNFSGPLLGALTFAIGGALQGQRSVTFGKGSERTPIFRTAGLDTTVMIPDAGAPGGRRSIPVYNFAIGRGECDRFAGNSNEEIANNYGEACDGVRVPFSNSSAYQVSGKLNYTFGTGSRIALSALASQNQARFFSYGLALFNPNGLFGQRDRHRVYTLQWTQQLSRSAERALALDVALSYQEDRLIQSPFDTATTPGGPGEGVLGFHLKSWDLLYDFASFPLDDELLLNYRNNRTGSRRSPLSLEDNDQFSFVTSGAGIDRANPYGLLNGAFAASGGPGGTLIMNKENRWIGKANLDWQADRFNRVKLGGELIRYYTYFYNHQLPTALFSDVYEGRPTRWNAFIEDRLDLGDLVLVGGLRYDWYDSRAVRSSFPRTSSMPGYNPNNPYDPALFVRDQSHDYLSPHVQVSFPVTERTNFRLSYAHQVQAPDFALIFAGINTDLDVTNTNQIYGADLDFGKTIAFEFGIRHAFSDDMVLDVAAYNRDNLATPAGRLVSAFDPLTRSNTDIRLMTNADFGNTRGIDVRLDRRFGTLFNGTIGYSYQAARSTGSDPFTYINFGSRIINQVSGGNQPPPQATAPVALSRPHSLTGAFSLNFPSDWNEGTALGAILQNVGVFAQFRYQSGTAYTTCTEAGGNEGVFSGQVCMRGQLAGGLNAERLPAFKQFDMRVTKGLSLGGLDMTAYLDVRNVLNLRNVLAVFVNTNDVRNEADFARRWATDSAQFAQEGARAGTRLLDGALDLRFGGARENGCAGYVDQGGAADAPACIYLIRAEQRWGDGNGVFDLAEQERASRAFYEAGSTANLNNARSEDSFLGPGRQMRLGFEVNF